MVCLCVPITTLDQRFVHKLDFETFELKISQITAFTDTVELGFGQEMVFHSSSKQLQGPFPADPGFFEAPATSTNSFTMGNVPDNLYAGVSCQEPGAVGWLPIHVEQGNNTEAMNLVLTPSNQVRSSSLF